MLRIVDRLILKELLAPMLFGISMFSLLIIASVVVNEAARFVIRHQLPASYFFKLVGLAAPEFIMLSIPMGVLLGTLLAIGRLSSDLEITALRTCGVSIFRVMAPFFIIGVLLSGLTFFSSERVVPYTRSALKELKNSVTSGQSGDLKMERVSWPIRSGGELQWVLIASSIESNHLENVKLFYFDADDPDRDFYLTADTAEWYGNKWTFFNARQVMLRPGDEGLSEVEIRDLEVPDFDIVPESLRNRAKTPEDLTVLQLQSVINEEIAMGESPTSKKILEYKTKLYQKFAVPLTPLFFVFIAVPLGIMRQRSSNAMGMGIALLVVLVYYVLYSVCLKLGTAGVIPPVIAAWIPNALLFVVGARTMQQREHN